MGATLNIWSSKAVHTKRIGNLAAVMDIMLKDVPDDPAAGVGIDLAFPLVLDSRLQIRQGIPPYYLLHDPPGLLQAADQFVRGTLGISRFIQIGRASCRERV